MLSRTRTQAFEGLGNLRLADIIALYEAEGWEGCDWTLVEYVELMLLLDSSLKTFYKERQPRS